MLEPGANPGEPLMVAACVGGMHRSGTSMVAGMLAGCGLYLGPEADLMPPNYDNPEGFFENLRFVELNEEVLNEIGGGWDCPPPVEAGWERAEGLGPQRAKAAELLGGFSGRELWGWKDPRNSLTLPFWKALVPGLRVVVCVRNPLEVALSLHRRNGLSYAFGLSLWREYHQRVLRDTLPEERVVTHYDSYFRDARGELGRVTGALGMEVSEEALEEASGGASVGMRHNWFGMGHMLEAGVSSEVVRLYASLCQETEWADSMSGGGRRQNGSERRENSGEASITGSRISEPDAVGRLNKPAFEAELLRRELEALRVQLQARDSEVHELRERLQESTEADGSDEQAAVQEAELRERLEQKTLEARASAERLAAQEAELRELRERLASVRSQPIRHALAALPAEATVIVVGEGDEQLPELDGRRRWRFPQTKDGAFADHPADSTAAIAYLEALRAEGGDYLLFPGTALWWLERYEGFRRHLESRYRVVVRQEDTCVVFGLRQPVVAENAGWRTKFEEVIAECRTRLEQDPAILDWDTGLDLANLFPQHNIFSPPTADRFLPYLDSSVDIVVSSPELTSLTEARRVARAAVVTSLVAEWQVEEAEVALPTASIVIPTYNGVTHTETCLATLMETLPPSFEGEIIVVDDASTDDTPEVLKGWEKQYARIRALRNPENAGFVTSCNLGAKAATGEIVVFLNNDTLPLPGWLPALLQTFRDHPDAGAVGGKLIYPDGRLQEAGGVIFADGSGANFGKGDHEVDGPLYNYVRRVDYCSGALLATRRSLFEEVGGFDARYRPAYYEDVDYCFAVRERGLRVYYQPESTVVHLEGATSGTDLSSGAKQYQVVNQEKFVEKWAHALQRQRPRPDSYAQGSWYALAARDEPDGATSR